VTRHVDESACAILQSCTPRHIELQQFAQLWAFFVDLFRFVVWLLRWLAGAG
jgi:hypothetical protein